MLVALLGAEGTWYATICHLGSGFLSRQLVTVFHIGSLHPRRKTSMEGHRMRVLCLCGSRLFGLWFGFLFIQVLAVVLGDILEHY